jgi:uncharacterized membrane protein YdjX (TVP38/TMEM64 family)
MKKTTQRLVIFFSLIAVLVLFFLFLYDILIPFIRMELAHDLDGAHALLASRGALGFFSVMLVEALQMVVVFIPAEFIQVSAGLSYPFWLALILCDLGVCLGASIIYALVNLFRFSNEAYEKNEKKIEQFAKGVRRKDRGLQILLYVLFLMPLVPFGAICYYGSHRKMKFHRYLFTVATGVIPSIISSNLLGTAARYFIGNQIPLPLLILLIVAVMALLIFLVAILLNKVYFRQNEGTPRSVYAAIVFGTMQRLWRRRQRLHLDDEAIRTLNGPFVALCNHESFQDVYYTNRLFEGRFPSYVVNKHYLSHPLVRKRAAKSGMIPKKLFYPDVSVPVRIMRMLRSGYPVVIFPEARLSITGRGYPILDKSATFYRRLKCDLVFVKIRGAYFAKPKWRKRMYRSDVFVSAVRVLKKEEIAAMTDAELNALIDETLRYDASDHPVNTYRRRNMAKGLASVLYRCADCGALYATEGVKNALVCSACGAVHRLNERYLFEEAPYSIGAYYERIKALEKRDLPSLRLEADVKAVVYRDKGKYKTRETGRCTLDANGFSYRSARVSFTIGFDALPALPFSCDREFETYYEGDLYYFYPVENRRQVVRWALIVDLIKELRDEETFEQNADQSVQKDLS